MALIARARTIRQKLNRILFASTLASLLVAGLLVTVLDVARQYRAIEGDLQTQADVLALATQAAISFQDARAGAESLSSLQAKPNVEGASLYDHAGKLFATFRAPGSPLALPSAAPTTGIHWDWTLVSATRPVKARQERVGFIHVVARHEIASRLLQHVAALAAVILASLGAGYLLAGRLQRAVTEPIMEVSRAARAVLGGETRGIRARRTSDDEVGELVDAFNSMLDELVRREDRLHESNRAKDRFIATLAHELRNPLAPIRTGLEILKRDPSNGPSSRMARDTMERQLVHMVHLIDDLLDISRLNTGKFSIAVSQVPLAALVETAVESCRPGIDAAGQRLTVHEHDTPLLVDADAVRMTQVFGNLLGNASKYTPHGGSIEIHTRLAGTMVEIEFRDSGIGIPAGSLDRVFDLFAQVHATEDRSQGGLGIGLFIVRNVVAMHGGTVHALSDGPGKGSRFTVRLPGRGEPRAAASPSAEAAVSARSGGKARRVLVVDDNKDAAATLGMMLDLQGHDVRVAHDGPHALELCTQLRPDFVVLDIGMPGMDGYEVARRIRAAPIPQPVLIAVTGWGTDADRANAQAAGFDHHLTKPADIEALESVIAGAGCDAGLARGNPAARST